jgi:hypothetical protein
MKSGFRHVASCLALIWTCITGPATAQSAPRSYAVMSLAGDAITVLGESQQVGSNLPSHTRNVVPIQEPIFDQAALLAADGVIKSLLPGAKPVLMMTSDPGLYKAQNAMFDLPADNLDNRAYLKTLLKERGVTHLLLVTKTRENANFKLTNGHAGNGSLEGLGFFVDEMFETRNEETLERATGMVVPYAYVKVRLLDAATLELVGQASAMESRIVVRPSASPKAQELWTTLSHADKVDHLRGLLGCAMRGTLPQLLGSAAGTRCQ